MTQTDDTVDFDTAVGNPAAYYANPQAIIADDGLSTLQKHRFLSEWAQDLADRQIADGEGMAPDDATSAHDAAMLKQVKAAIAQMNEEPDVTLPAAARAFWTRLKDIIG